MPNILQRNNPKAERFQQLLALAGLAQQQEQGQSSLQQQLAFHQASLQQQEADVRQMQAWREMQGQQAAATEKDRSGEFWGGTLPAEYAKVQEMMSQRKAATDEAANHEASRSGEFWGGTLPAEYAKVGAMNAERAQQHSDAVAALTQQQTAHEQAIKAQLLEHYSSLPPDQQNSVRGLLRTQYPWFAEGDDARHTSEVESTYNRLLPAIATPGITPAQREQQLTDWATKSFVHPDVIKKLRAFTPPTPVVTTPTVTPAPITTISQDQTPLMDINSREGIRRNPGAEALLRVWKSMNSTPPSPALSGLNVSPQDFGYPN